MSARRNEKRIKAHCTRSPESVEPTASREAVAVILVCGGLLTLLALGSYHPTDLSLNTSGSSDVSNWIGPAGAYWADLLFQGFGVGAYVLGAGAILAGGRAFAGRRILPGLREAIGIVLLMATGSILTHLIFDGRPQAYAPGGILGALCGQILRERFARLGAYILASGLSLIALALTADGILTGLGWRGISMVQRLASGIRRRLFGATDFLRRVQRRAASRYAPRLPTPGAADRHRRGRSEAPPMPIPLDTDAADSDEAGVSLAALMPETMQARMRRPGRGSKALAEASGEREHADLVHKPRLALVADAADALTPKRDDTVQEAQSRPRQTTSEPQIINVRPDLDPAAVERAAREAVPRASKSFELPPASLLDYEATARDPVDPQELRDNALRLTKTLKDYGIDGHVREIRPGPVVTMYEYVPGPGIKLSKIASLADDLAMSMEALRVRIVAPIPGKGAVGIEIPNEFRETVYLKEIIAHDAFRKASSCLTMALGKDIEGAAYVADLARMPHLLVAGATGAGKSVSINAMIMSVLFKATPDEVKMIMVDPKMLELSVYEGIPHLLLPVVTDPKKAALALRWAVEEMERRYELLSEVGVRSIDGYNNKVRSAAARGQKVTVPAKDTDEEPTVCAPMPYLLVIVDELADLMMVASREVETSIMRLAQMARAAGIHLILATQRPSVDVLTGVIKANFPTRIAFQVASRHDSRTIIDGNGAEHLLGRGDMLFLSPGAGGILRVHGAYVSEEEIERAVQFAREQGRPEYDESILAPRDDGSEPELPEQDLDEMYDQAVAIVAETRQASISMIQRRLRIGYNRAARMVERMETEGIVGPADGAKPREVLVSNL